MTPQDIGKRCPHASTIYRPRYPTQSWQLLRILLRFLLVSILRYASVGMCPLKQLSLSCFISPWFDDDPFDWDGRLRHQRVNRPRRTQRPQRRCQQRPSKQKGWRHESYRQCNMKTFTKWRISKLRRRLRGRGRTVQCLCGLSFLVIQKPQFQKQTLLK